MSRRKRHRADGGFVLLSRQVTRSAAFCSLSPRAVALLIALMDRYEGHDNRVSMSRDEAAAWLKSGTHQAAEAFAELEAKGFIRCHERGGFTRKVPHATIWALTMYGRGGQKATLDFLSWHSDGTSKNKTRVPLRHKYGYQVGTRDGTTGAKTAPARPFHGCQYNTSAGADTAQLIESTIEGRAQNADTAPLAISPIGNRGAKAAWLRSHLAAGTLTRDTVAALLAIAPTDVDQIAGGKTGLSNSSWNKLAEVAGKRSN